MTNLRRFTKATIHTGDQPGPPSPYPYERRHNIKVSSGTSNSTADNAQQQCALDLGKCKVNPIGCEGRIDAIGWATSIVLSQFARG